jgi:murein DD-endopeptidase MepM/ murein hydrolase activator NlpD
VKNPKEAFTKESACEYGYRYLMGMREFHPALDIVSPFESTCISIADGKIVKVGFEKYSGNYIVMYHRFDNEEFYSFFCHLDEIFVLEGQFVEQGDDIGIIGATGKSCYGIHLHFAIYKREKDRYMSFNFVTNSLHRKKVEIRKMELYYFLK